MESNRQSGFSLIELLVVVAIILVIVAIAIPNFLASRMAANESGAVQETRAITTAEVAYHTQYGVGYAAQLSFLGDGAAVTVTSAGLIDSVLASGTKTGYHYNYAALNQDAAGHYQSFTVNSNPASPGFSGHKYFFADETSIIHVNLLGPASSADPAI